MLRPLRSTAPSTGSRSAAETRIATAARNADRGASTEGGNYRDTEAVISSTLFLAREGLQRIEQAKTTVAYQIDIAIQNGFLNSLNEDDLPILAKGMLDKVSAGYAGLEIASALKQAASILRIRLSSTMVPNYYGRVTLVFFAEEGRIAMVSVGGKRVLKLSEIYQQPQKVKE